MYPPGHQAAEPEIAEQLGMSRTPVHEAIIRLQEEGLVQVLPRRGVLICPISADDIREIYDVLIARRGHGGGAAWRTGREPRAAAAADALEQATASHGARRWRATTCSAWAAADERFHQLLTDRCGNRRLARIAGTVMDQAHRSRLYTLHLRPKPLARPRSTGRSPTRSDGRMPMPPRPQHAPTAAARDALLPLLEQYGMRNL